MVKPLTQNKLKKSLATKLIEKRLAPAIAQFQEIFQC